jgi:outer membrane receptor protein involved in Fe transport
MKRNISFILFFFLIINCFAQKKVLTYKLYGQILDNKNEGLPYVAIGIFNVKDSSYVKGSATETNGKFSIQVAPGNYYAKVSFLSFEDKIISNILVSNKDVDLKKSSLIPSSKNLAEFDVIEEKKLMELDLDKRVYNVEKDVTNQGADASEILDNVPSVSVDVDGNVSLRGSENVRVLINGKPSGLAATSTAEALKQLQGNQIEKIEIVTNPSARYDAEGEVGIINIILKKDRREGFNGSINVDFGYPNNYGGGFNITLKKKNINVFTGYGISFRESPGFKKTDQQFTYPDTSFSYTSDQQMFRLNTNHNFRLGTEVFLNNYNSITISGKYNVGVGDNKTNLTYTDYDEFDVVTQSVERDEIEEKDRYSYDISMNYRKTFKQKDRLLTFDISKSERVDNENSTITQINDVVISENLEQRIFNNDSGDNWLFQTDYIHPVKKGKIEFGLKYTNNNINDDYAVEQFNDTVNDWNLIPGFNNLVLYNEKVSASYLMFGKKIKNFSFQFGIRSEYTEVTTELVNTNSINKRDYLDFFPSTHFSYELKKDNSLQIGYSRRIRRPRHWWLLPFFSFSDSRSTPSGNPNLNPEYTDSYELGHLKNWKKSSLLTSLYYRYSTQVMDWVVFSDEEGITRRMPINLGVKDAFGLEFSGSYEIIKWWNLRGSFNFFREIRDGEFNGIQYDIDQYSWSTRLNSKWVIKKKVNLQASINYRAPKQSPQGETRARYSIDSGFSFDLLKGNGTLAFNVKDLLNTRKRISTSHGENFVSEFEMQWRSRYFRLSFTYRVNQKKKRGNDKIYNDFDGGGEG